MTILSIYAIVGAFAGFIAGLFGVGGGLVIVPVLVLVFESQRFSPEIIVHLAIGTSLATIVFTSLSSIYAHHRRGAVLWNVFFRLAPGIVSGALIGAAIADLLPAEILRKFFGVFELGVAVYLALDRKPSPQGNLPGRFSLSGVGFGIGSISALVGIGGGTLTVPFLVWRQIAMPNAVATSAACGLPIAFFGAIGFIITGWQTPHLPPWSSGYLYLPAWFGIIAFSVLFAPLGAWLAHRLAALHLKRYFALFLTFLGLKMLF